MHSNDKYTLVPTDERPMGPDVTLFRLKALRNIGRDVKAGDQGGLVGGPISLAQEGDCWIYPRAIVCKGATVSDNAQVRSDSRLVGNVRMYGNSVVDIAVELVGDVELKGGESLVDFLQVISLNIVGTGHYLKGGNTVFAFVCQFDSRSAPVHLAINSVNCHPRVATELAAKAPGQRLTLIVKNDIPFPLGGSDRTVEFADIDKAIKDIVHVQNSKLISLKHVTYLG